ncbi:hypothetical protein K491DRAFT_746892 [Lophiostoma macrostomum CBS 122681]|uniref:Uncharacterized protein n=1 Tax=Lophiostoma macrostomum CBS 122681 TaxID=1314788 RepID=A0A6A6TR62_9PLEO|nr:hypothetical protein K491DRAFT_746892 [Lophiostoma macrostomum CBS 122681]
MQLYAIIRRADCGANINKAKEEHPRTAVGTRWQLTMRELLSLSSCPEMRRRPGGLGANMAAAAASGSQLRGLTSAAQARNNRFPPEAGRQQRANSGRGMQRTLQIGGPKADAYAARRLSKYITIRTVRTAGSPWPMPPPVPHASSPGCTRCQQSSSHAQTRTGLDASSPQHLTPPGRQISMSVPLPGLRIPVPYRARPCWHLAEPQAISAHALPLARLAWSPPGVQAGAACNGNSAARH